MRVFIKRLPATITARGVAPYALPCIVCEAIEFRGVKRGCLPRSVLDRAMRLADDCYKDVEVFVADPDTDKFRRRMVVHSITKG